MHQMNLFNAIWLAVVVISILYTALIVWFISGWNSIADFHPKKKVLSTKVSVIVPFYNEQETIQSSLEQLLRQDIQTKEYELIFVDDNSTDDSSEMIKKKEAQYHRLTYLQNKGKGKKAALESGIEQASGDLIVTTDADCSYSDKWLHALVEYFETYNPSLVIGPVVFEKGNSWFQKFQQLEFASLVGSGAGAAGIDHAIMCNGANLAFKKSEYEKLEDPFNRNLISGDDVFLLHNFKQLNASIDFIKSKDSIVQTKAVTGLKEFTAQRTRWTAKSTGYQDGDTLFVAIIVLVINAILFLSALLLVKSVLFWKPLIFLFVVKTLVDTLFFYRISGFFGIKQLLKWIPLFQFVYLIYVPLIGLFGLFSSGKNVTKM